VTDFAIINVHVDELLSARIWQHKLCATLSANVNINYCLPIKGQSKPWPEAMKAITNQTKMDVSAILEYFAPLIDWLKEQNKGQRSGWTDTCILLFFI
jgi:hypothetical protein